MNKIGVEKFVWIRCGWNNSGVVCVDLMWMEQVWGSLCGFDVDGTRVGEFMWI